VTPSGPPSESTVLVTGATGFTGGVLTEKLCRRGCRVRAIARARSDVSALETLGVEIVRGDVYEADVVRRAARGIEYLFHVAAAYRDPGIADQTYRDVHVTSTQRLAAEVAGQPGFRCMVHVSTVGVHGHIEHPPADETAPFRPGDIYQETKAEAETWLHAFARDNHLPYTVIRPAAIMGPSDERLLKVFRMAAWPVYPVLGRGRGLYHLIHVDDLTDCLLVAAVHPAARGEAFLCGNDEPTDLLEMGRLAAEVMGVSFRPLRLPAGPFFALAAACEAVCKPLGVAPPLYRRRVAFYTKDRAFDTAKMRTVLEFTPSRTNAAAIRETVQGYLDRGLLPNRGTRR
jgi:dihydroflavonol-4-reductase